MSDIHGEYYLFSHRNHDKPDDFRTSAGMAFKAPGSSSWLTEYDGSNFVKCPKGKLAETRLEKEIGYVDAEGRDCYATYSYPRFTRKEYGGRIVWSPHHIDYKTWNGNAYHATIAKWREPGLAYFARDFVEKKKQVFLFKSIYEIQEDYVVASSKILYSPDGKECRAAEFYGGQFWHAPVSAQEIISTDKLQCMDAQRNVFYLGIKADFFLVYKSADDKNPQRCKEITLLENTGATVTVAITSWYGGSSHPMPLPDISRWMETLYEHIKDVDVRYLKLPGTHDSGAFNEENGPAVRCQNKSIGEQLECGVRVLDLRVTIGHNRPMLHHEGCFPLRDKKAQSLEVAVDQIADFLASRPKEFVIINLRAGSGSLLNDKYKYGSEAGTIHSIIRKRLMPYILRYRWNMDFRDNVTLASIAASQYGRERQLLILLNNDLSEMHNFLVNPNDWSEARERIYWPQNAFIRSTWRGYQSDLKTDMPYKNSHLPLDIRDELAKRPVADKLFMPSEWYMWSIWVWDAAIYNAHARFCEFLNDGTAVQQKQTTNIVNVDFAHEYLCRLILDMNLKYPYSVPPR